MNEHTSNTELLCYEVVLKRMRKNVLTPAYSQTNKVKILLDVSLQREKEVKNGHVLIFLNSVIISHIGTLSELH